MGKSEKTKSRTLAIKQMIYHNLLFNKKNWNRLIHSWKSSKLPHAILFHGPTGSGKEGLAVEMAAFMNCTTPKDEEPCGSCPSCKATRSFQHRSVKLILPLPRGKIKSSEDPVTKAFSACKFSSLSHQP